MAAFAGWALEYQSVAHEALPRSKSPDFSAARVILRANKLDAGFELGAAFVLIR